MVSIVLKTILANHHCLELFLYFPIQLRVQNLMTYLIPMIPCKWPAISMKSWTI